MIDDGGDGTTHAEGCYTWGRKHYGCAEREIERLQAQELSDGQAKARDDMLAYIARLEAKVSSWEASCTGRHGSQMPCVRSAHNGDAL